MERHRHFAASVLSAALVAGSATAAYATPDPEPVQSGSLTIASGVLYDDCLAYPYGYTVTVSDDQPTWNLVVDAVHVDGRVVTGDFIPGRGSATGAGDIQFCGGLDEPGAHTLVGKLVDFTGRIPDVPLSPVAFTMRKAYTRTKIVSVSERRARPGQRVAIKVTSEEEHPGTYRQNTADTVALQVKRKGDWKRLPGSRGYTDNDGRAKVRIRFRGKKLRIRAVTPANSAYQASYSRAITIKRRS